MIRTTLKITGMMCGMCEAHINDAIRAAFPVRQVRSSRRRGETVILSDAPLEAEALRKTIQATGYTLESVHTGTDEKSSLLSRLFHR